MHDESYKLLFSHPEMVADLLRGFVPHRWVKELDFSTLEKLNASYVTDELRHRHDDLVWRVRFRKRWLYIYLLLEFQSSVDTFMAVRILSYTGLLYQDIIRTQQLSPNNKLPPVLPIVLYNGEPRWQAAVELAELLEPAPLELQPYQPQQRYLLLDEGAYTEADLAALQNLVAAVFRLENSRTPQDVLDIVSALIEWLKQPEQSSLRRAFTIWIKRVILTDVEVEAAAEQITELDEVRTMLAQRVEQWKQQWHAEGLEEGQQKGRQEGRQEGLEQGSEQALRWSLKNILTQRFGELPDDIIHQIDTAKRAQLEQWLTHVLTTPSLTALLDSE